MRCNNNVLFILQRNILGYLIVIIYSIKLYFLFLEKVHQTIVL